MDEFQTVSNQEADESYCAWLNEMDRQMNDRTEHHYYISANPSQSSNVLDY